MLYHCHLGDFDGDLPAQQGRRLAWLFGRSCSGADQNKRYAKEWTDTENVGFAVANVTQTHLRMSYYTVPKGQREAVLALEVVTERSKHG